MTFFLLILIKNIEKSIRVLKEKHNKQNIGIKAGGIFILIIRFAGDIELITETGNYLQREFI